MNNHVKQLISLLQHSFLRNRSCTTQLLSVFNAISQNLDKNIERGSNHPGLDLAKAFDSVYHYKLMF